VSKGGWKMAVMTFKTRLSFSGVHIKSFQAMSLNGRLELGKDQLNNWHNPFE
jgi:hypothetical protein